MKPTNTRWFVLVALSLAAAIAYLSRNCLAVAVADKQILEDLNCTKDEMGLVMGGFYFCYAIFQVPGGWLGHRWGSRRMLPLLAIAWAIPTVAVGITAGFYTVFATYLLIGVAQAGLFPNSADTISKWFPNSRTAVACGALGSSMSAGGAAAIALSGILLAYISWRWLFALFALPGLVWAPVFYLWFRNRPEQHPSVNEAELEIIHADQQTSTEDNSFASVDDPPESIPWGVLLSSRTLWMICGQQFFRAAGYIFYSTWFPTYLKETRGVTTMESGILSSLPLLAVVVGGITGGVFVDWILKRTGSRRISRQYVGVVSLSLCAFFILLAYFVNDATSVVLLISIGSFCATVAGPCASAVTIETAGKHVPITFSVMNMVGNIGAAVCPVLVAQVAKVNWELVLIFFVAIYVAGALCWVMINPEARIFESDASEQSDEIDG